MHINSTTTIVVYKGSLYRRVNVAGFATPEWFLMTCDGSQVIKEVIGQLYYELENAFCALRQENMEGFANKLADSFKGWLKEKTKEIG